MNPRIWTPSRRVFLGSVAASLGASAFFTVPGLFAEELTRTPRMTEGPFYPDRLPLDTDSDLVIVNNSITPAVGTITHLTGRVLNSNGDPLRDLVVEIWQVDNRGVYLHTADSGRRQRDTNFQGFGRATTNARIASDERLRSRRTRGRDHEQHSRNDELDIRHVHSPRCQAARHRPRHADGRQHRDRATRVPYFGVGATGGKCSWGGAP